MALFYEGTLYSFGAVFNDRDLAATCMEFLLPEPRADKVVQFLQAAVNKEKPIIQGVVAEIEYNTDPQAGNYCLLPG